MSFDELGAIIGISLSIFILLVVVPVISFVETKKEAKKNV